MDAAWCSETSVNTSLTVCPCAKALKCRKGYKKAMFKAMYSWLFPCQQLSDGKWANSRYQRSRMTLSVNPHRLLQGFRPQHRHSVTASSPKSTFLWAPVSKVAQDLNVFPFLTWCLWDLLNKPASVRDRQKKYNKVAFHHFFKRFRHEK